VSGSDPSEAEGTLRRLEERLDRASAAAERLISDATRAAANPAPPPSGWQVPEAEAEQRSDGDLEALIALARSVRELVPPDLQQRLVEALREVLQAVRDLLDWYLERLDRQRAEPTEVEDIPIL
jgi:hypothetical protein